MARHRPRRRPALSALIAVLTTTAVLTTACGSDDDATTPAAATGSKGTTQLTIGIVPSLSLGLLKLGESKGFFADEGLTLTFTNVDSGPNVVTGVVAGQYDIGYTAYAPPLLALAGGAPLKLVTNVDTNGPKGNNGGLLVLKDSGITSFAGLAGKKIATNAPRSLLSLTVRQAIAGAGGDPSGIQLVPLPFAQIGKAVADKQVDAGLILQPFQTKALAEYPDLVDLGDTTAEALPEGSPSGVLFTSAKTQSGKSAALDAFERGVTKSIAAANADLDAAKAAGAELAGLTAEQAKAIPLNPYSQTVTAADLTPLLDLMVTFEWIKAKPDLAGFLG